MRKSNSPNDNAEPDIWANSWGKNIQAHASNRQTCCPTGSICRQTDGQEEREKREKDRTDRQTGKQTDRQTERQTDGRTDRETRQTDRQTEAETAYKAAVKNHPQEPQMMSSTTIHQIITILERHAPHVVPTGEPVAPQGDQYLVRARAEFEEEVDHKTPQIFLWRSMGVGINRRNRGPQER